MDDQSAIRLLLSTRLSIVPEVEIVGEAGNGTEAIEMATRLRPDAMILDLDMPAMSGAEAIPILRVVHPDMRILVYSAKADRYPLDGPNTPDATLVKGVELDTLVSTLLQLLAPPQ